MIDFSFAIVSLFFGDSMQTNCSIIYRYITRILARKSEITPNHNLNICFLFVIALDRKPNQSIPNLYQFVVQKRTHWVVLSLMLACMCANSMHPLFLIVFNFLGILPVMVYAVYLIAFSVALHKKLLFLLHAPIIPNRTSLWSPVEQKGEIGMYCPVDAESAAD